MILIIHGENFSKTRKVITELQQKLQATNKTELDILKITPQELAETAASFDLFSTAPFVVLDISNAGRKNLADYVEVIKVLPKETHLVVQSNKDLSNANVFIKSAGELKAKVLHHRQEPAADVFKLLDALYLGDRKKAYTELKKLVLDQADPFYLFSMIIYAFRNIMFAAFDQEQKIPPFNRGKAIKAASSYQTEEITKVHEKLYQTDKGMKTGKVPPELAPVIAIEEILKHKK